MKMTQKRLSTRLLDRLMGGCVWIGRAFMKKKKHLTAQKLMNKIEADHGVLRQRTEYYDELAI